MDNKNVLHTEQVNANNKTFFFDLKSSVNGSHYLKITQSRKVDEELRERASIILFENDIAKFSAGLMKSLMVFQGKSQAEIEAYKEALRVNYPNAYTPWTKEDEERLTSLFTQGYEVEDLANELQRNEGGVRARISKLGLTPEAIAQAV